MPRYRSTFYRHPIQAEDLTLATAAIVNRILQNHFNIDCISIEPGYALMQRNGRRRNEYTRFDVRVWQLE